MDQFVRMQSFVEVVESGSFSAAAKKLGRSKALMSKYVRELEDEMGILLLNRTTRQLSLTEPGHEYYLAALDILQHLCRLQDKMRSSSTALKGKLKVTAPRALVEMNFSAALTEFAKSNPQVVLDVTLEDRLIDMVEDGYDVAIRIARLSDSALIAKKLCEFRMYLCASQETIKQYGTPEKPVDLARLPCVLDTNIRSGSNWPFINEEGNDFFVSVSGQISVNSPEAVRNATLAGLGFAMIPSFIALPDIRKGNLVSLLEDRVQSGSGIYAIYPHRRHVPVKVREFVDFLAKWFKDSENY